MTLSAVSETGVEATPDEAPLTRRLAASLVYIGLAKLPGHRAGRDLLAASLGLEDGTLLRSLVWMRARGVVIRVERQPLPGLPSDVQLIIPASRCRAGDECAGPHMVEEAQIV